MVIKRKLVPVLLVLSSIDNGAHGTEMLLLKIQVCENFE